MGDTRTRGTENRNRLMAVVAVLAVGLLVAAAAGTYRAFSYLAVGFVAVVIGAASLERNASEFDLAPYTGLVVGLALVCAAGFTGIWLLWNPSVTNYTYTLGLPQSTLVYVLFLWLLPIVGAFYYALVFPRIGSDEVVDDIVDAAFAAQREERFPLAPDTRPDSTGAGVETDGGAGPADADSEGGETR